MKKLILCCLLLCGIAQAEENKLRIGYLPITDHLLMVGLTEAFDGQVDPNVEAVRFADWATLAEALRSGKLDGAFILAPLAYQINHTVRPLKIVLLAHRNGSAIAVDQREHFFDRPALSIAIPQRFSTHNALLHMYLDAQHQSGQNIQYPELAPPDMPAALAHREINGFIAAEPFPAKAQLMKAGEILVNSYEIWPDHPDCVVAFGADVIAKDRARVGSIVKRLLETAAVLEPNRARAVDSGIKLFGHSRELLETVLLDKHRISYQRLVPVQAELARLYNYMHDTLHVLAEVNGLDQLIDPTLVGEVSRK